MSDWTNADKRELLRDMLGEDFSGDDVAVWIQDIAERLLDAGWRKTV